jgi:hypothetical protein
MNPEKVDFLKNGFVSLVKDLDPETKPQWGVMNAQQMVEHMSDSVRIANGKIRKKILTPEDQLFGYKNFMMSEKPFKPNTKNIELPSTALPVKNPAMQAAIEELQKEIDDFFKFFENDKEQKVTNPFFGDLNFEEWVQLLHKHAVHHAKQFALIE